MQEETKNKIPPREVLRLGIGFGILSIVNFVIFFGNFNLSILQVIGINMATIMATAVCIYIGFEFRDNELIVDVIKTFFFLPIYWIMWLVIGVVAGIAYIMSGFDSETLVAKVLKLPQEIGIKTRRYHENIFMDGLLAGYIGGAISGIPLLTIFKNVPEVIIGSIFFGYVILVIAGTIRNRGE